MSILKYSLLIKLNIHAQLIIAQFHQNICFFGCLFLTRSYSICYSNKDVQTNGHIRSTYLNSYDKNPSNIEKLRH